MANLEDTYKPEYCLKLIEHMEQGFSYETFGAIINVSRATLYNWEKTHEDWKEAKEEAFLKCQMFWERLGRYAALGISVTIGSGENAQVINGKDINTIAWIFNMKNRFNWRDKHDFTSDDEKLEVIPIQYIKPQEPKVIEAPKGTDATNPVQTNPQAGSSVEPPTGQGN